MAAPLPESAPLLGALDDNLGLPYRAPDWSAFFAAEGAAVTATTAVADLTADLVRHRPDFAYIPAASYFQLRRDPAYRALASALTASGKPEQASVLVVRSDSPVARWQDLRGARLGYINTVCTTSYVAPAILLSRAGLALQSFFRPVAVAPWQGQIDAVLSGAVEATMVYEDVWSAKPENAAATRVLARIDRLPTPPVIVRPGLVALAARLRHALLTFAPPAGRPIYAGFTDYRDDLMRPFFADLEAAETAVLEQA